jgi:hypothetical protein
MNVTKQIRQEVNDYLSKQIRKSENVPFSEYKLKKRIAYFMNRHYPTGKMSPDGYEYWFDIIQPRANHAIKNLRLDSKHLMVFSKNPVGDFAAVYIANTALFDWMWENGKAEELNEAIEQFVNLGNVLFRKTSDGYALWDPWNTYITNQAARTIDETAVIERFEMGQSELRRMQRAGIYKNVDEVIAKGGAKETKKEENTTQDPQTTPYYVFYRRTGEVSEAELRKAQGKTGGDPDNYVLARIIVADTGSQGDEVVVFAEQFAKGETMSDYYKEAHYGPYKGSWWREGMYELLFDHQVRANDIGIQIARGLEWSGKVLFRHSDINTVSNIRTALENGALIKSQDLQQVQVRQQGFDQLVADYNRIIQEADSVANSLEIVQGQALPSGTPFQLGRMLDNNANKLFAFLRQKISTPYKRVFKDFVMPKLIEDLSREDIIRLTGDPIVLENFYEMAAQGWYLSNLVKIGPHTPEIAEALKAMKMEELRAFEPTVQNQKEIWKGVLPRLHVTITGENFNVEEQETIATMLQFEQDMPRRAFLMDYIYRQRGIPVPPPAQPDTQDVPRQGGGQMETPPQTQEVADEVPA